MSESLARVLEAAARLQAVVPDAVLVGGSAAAFHACHRDSVADDHVVADLAERFDAVLAALEATSGWVTNRVVPEKLVLGELGGIETGVRQLRRRLTLETMEIELASGHHVVVPTIEETLRIKGYLVVRRNQTRDYLDLAALSDRYGIENAAAVLSRIDAYYEDQRHGSGVATQLARQLADPQPKDISTTKHLDGYKNLDPRWHDWKVVAGQCRSLAAAMVRSS